MRQLDLAALGKIAEHAVAPCFLPISPGSKAPTYSGWPTDAKPLDNIETRFRLDPTINVGLLLGHATNIIDIEVDGPAGEESIRQLIGDIETLTFASSKGKHRLYQYDARLAHLGATLRNIEGLPDIEIRVGANAAQTAIPPSVTSEFERLWLNDAPIASLPDDVIERIAALRPSKPPVAVDTCDWDVIGKIEEKLRDEKLEAVVNWLRRNHVQHGSPQIETTGNVKIALDRCPHRPEETDGGPVLYINYGGSAAYNCKHTKCAGRTFDDLVNLWGTIAPKPKPKSRFNILTSSDLANGDFSVRFLIARTLVAKQTLIISGAQKTLKTSVIIDAAISLASGTRFLGALEVLQACKVLVMSGESGLAVLKETANRICHQRSLQLERLTNLLWTDSLPKFYSIEDMDALRDLLEVHRPEVLICDPAYLCMSGDDAGNLMKQGEQLGRIGTVCSDLGITFVLAHHNKKPRGKPFTEPTMEDMAWSGFSEFARQWWLIGRRERFVPGSGEHQLHFIVGGSAGHSAQYCLDVDEGSIDDPGGRKWDVTLQSTHAAKAEQSREKLQSYRETILERLAKAPSGLVRTPLLKGVPKNDQDAVVNHLIEIGDIVETDVPNRGSKTKTVKGYTLAATAKAA